MKKRFLIYVIVIACPGCFSIAETKVVETQGERNAYDRIFEACPSAHLTGTVGKEKEALEYGLCLGSVKEDNFAGVMINFLYGRTHVVKKLYGGQISFINELGRNYGLQVGGWANFVEENNGWQLAFGNCGKEDNNGLISGVIVNRTGKVNNGAQVAGFANGCEENVGLQSGILNYVSVKNAGMQCGLVNCVRVKNAGMQCGLINVTQTADSHGGQLGLVNAASDSGGFQIGLLNASGDSKIQFGLVNYAEKGNFLPITLLMNW